MSLKNSCIGASEHCNENIIKIEKLKERKYMKMITVVKIWLFARCASIFGVVYSFQPTFVLNDFSPRNKCCTRSRTNRHMRMMCSDSEGFTRREIFSRTCSPALGMALSLLGQPLDANAAEAISRSDVTTTSNANAMLIPFSSVREQKVITLSNGLQVLLVNDKLSSQSKAALVVDGAGQFTDYDDLPGLAHLMEHMVLSSNRNSNFSKKGDLEEWLSDNGGASNAFTAYEQVSLLLRTVRGSYFFSDQSALNHCRHFQTDMLSFQLSTSYLSTSTRKILISL